MRIMCPGPKVVKISGRCQHDNWGGSTLIPKLLSLEATDRKYSEYWLGIYPEFSATISGADETLFNFICRNKTLSRRICVAPFPFLLKVLDIQKMLSIQVHPDERTALLGFTSRSSDDIYKDPYTKPEALYALTDIYLLQGFLPPLKLSLRLSQIVPLRPFKEVFDSGGYSGLLSAIIQLPYKAVIQINSGLVELAKQLNSTCTITKESAHYWLLKYLDHTSSMPLNDIGLILIYFLNIVHLPKGFVTYTPAGIVHSYLQGGGLEIMTSSDNVLRYGLTNKKTSPELALKSSYLSPHKPKIEKPVEVYKGIQSYDFPSSFGFSVIENEGKPFSTPIVNCKTLNIILILRGQVSVKVKEKGSSNFIETILQKGESAALLPDGLYTFDICKHSMAVIVGTNAPFNQ